jgi:hypothetical protein
MSENGVKGCRFLLGASGMMIVALAGELPKDASTYTLRATPTEIIFKAGYNEIARFPFANTEVFNELAKLSNIGAVEYVEGEPLPGALTNMLYVETMRGAA